MRPSPRRSVPPRVVVAAAIAASLCLLARPAAAQSTAPAASPPEGRSYRWELLASGLSLGAVASWSSGKSVLDFDLGEESRDRWRYVFYASAPLWLASGPVIHLANGAEERVWESLTLRVASPIVLALAGSLIGLRYDCPDNRAEWGTECWPQGMIAGLTAGFLLAPVIDAFFIGRPIPPPYVPPDRAPAPTARIALLPSPDGKGHAISLLGTF